MGALSQIVYTSAAIRDLSRAELLGLLKGSVERNSRLGITGLLLYKNCCFLQALEGEEETVVLLFAKISRDPRHRHVIPLIHEPIKQRYFPDSAMAFPDLDSPEVRNLPGYSEFLNTPLKGELLAKDIPKCQRLLLLFKQNTQLNNDRPLKD
jgi:hypothetical protein